MGDLVPRKTVVKQGGLALGGLAGGIALLALHAIAGVPALIVGGIVAVIGLAVSGSREDRAAGMITLGAGILTAARILPLIGGLAGTLLTISGIGLLVMGGINLYKFIKNYRQRM